MADISIVRNGYGQVEPTQLSAQKTGQIYASLPLDTEVDVLQNGEFMFYDYANGMVTAGDAETVGEPMLVFNEIKLYEDFWRTSYKDFAMIRVNDGATKGENYVTSKLATAAYGDGATNTAGTVKPHTEYPYRMDGMAPRLFKTNVGDIMITNMVEEGDYNVGDLLGLKIDSTSKTLVLCPAASAASNIAMRWQVAKSAQKTMPDGQPALKLQRVI